MKKLGASNGGLLILSGILGIALVQGSGSGAPLLLIPSLAFSLRAFSVKEPRKATLWSLGSLLSLVIAGSLPLDHVDSLVICGLGLVPGIVFLLVSHEFSQFLSWLCLTGFPITPFFLGEGVLLDHLGTHGVTPVLLFFIAFVLNGVVMARSFVQQTWLKSARQFD